MVFLRLFGGLRNSHVYLVHDPCRIIQFMELTPDQNWYDELEVEFWKIFCTYLLYSPLSS